MEGTTKTTRKLRRQRAKLTISEWLMRVKGINRVHILNDAIDALRNNIPNIFVSTSRTKSTFTKLEVITIAIEYNDVLERTIIANKNDATQIQMREDEDEQVETMKQNTDISTSSQIHDSLFDNVDTSNNEQN